MRSVLNIKKRKLFNNKRGSFLDIIIWMVVGLVVVLFLGFWLWSYNMLNNVMTNLPTTANGINMSLISQQTIGQINTAQNIWLPTIAFIIMIAEALALFITNYFVKEHPLMLIPYILVVAIAVVIAVILSNFYQSLLTGNYPFTPYLLGMTAADYILIYLPLWTAIIGAFGVIFLVAGIITNKGDVST